MSAADIHEVANGKAVAEEVVMEKEGDCVAEKAANGGSEACEKAEEATPAADGDKSENLIEDLGPATALDKKIIKQMEYYFGNANLSKDKFLQEQIKKDDGWVSLEVLGTFNRLKQLSEDSQVVARALRKSTTDLLEVSVDSTSVRRNPKQPLPELNAERKRDLASRTIYSKRFPATSSLDTLMDFFGTFGFVEQVVMRKNAKREFKGSVFVLFRKKEDAETFLGKDSVEFEGTALEARMTREEYFSKHAETVKQAKEEDQKKTEELLAKEQEGRLQAQMVKGAVLKVTGLSASTGRDEVKDFFKALHKVMWVDLDKDAHEALVRFDSEGSAQEVWEKAKEATGKVTLSDQDLEAQVLEGEEEVEHWKHLLQQRDSVRAVKGGRHQGKGRRGGRHQANAGSRQGLRSGGRGQKRGYDGIDGNVAKKSKDS